MEEKNITLPNTIRLQTKGIKMSDFINKNVYKKEIYNNPARLKLSYISPTILGVAVQTYYDIKNNNFKPLEFAKSRAYTELVEKYLNENEKDLITFCFIYADLVAHARVYIEKPIIKAEDVTDNDRYNVIKLSENIDKFMERKNFKVKYSEVGFEYTEKVETDKYIINNTCFGDLDFITNKNTILDIKCTRTNASTTALAQQLVYYLMGCLGDNDLKLDRSYFKSINEIGFYNPILDNYIYMDLNELTNVYKLKFLERVMNYPIKGYLNNKNEKGDLNL